MYDVVGWEIEVKGEPEVSDRAKCVSQYLVCTNQRLSFYSDL